MMNKLCEKCRQTEAKVLVNKDGGDTDWWFCLSCLKTVMAESPLGNFRWRPRGIPEYRQPGVTI